MIRVALAIAAAAVLFAAYIRAYSDTHTHIEDRVGKTVGDLLTLHDLEGANHG